MFSITTNNCRRHYVRCLAVLFVLFWISPSSKAQVANSSGLGIFDRQGKDADELLFELRTYNTAAEDLAQSRLIVQLGVSNGQLQFIKSGKAFSADFHVDLAIRDTTGSEVKTDTWRETVFADDFDQTVAQDRYYTSQEIYTLAPGYYDLEISIQDVETNRTGKQNKRMYLRNFLGDSLAVSDILFLRSVAFLEDRIPQVKEDAHANTLFAYYEIYNIPTGDSIQLEYSVQDIRKEITGSRSIISPGPVISDYIEIDRDSVSERELSVTLHLTHGARTLTKEQFLNPTQKRSESFLADLDKAIDVLTYIAKEKEIKYLKSLQGDEKVMAFKEFWKKKDPTPETPENEYMTTYYRRIEMANKEFSDFVPGWKTQMGMVLVRIGPPQYVDRSYQSSRRDIFSNQPVLLWYYPRYSRVVAFRYVAGEYRIDNYSDVFDLIGGDEIRL